MSDNPVLVLGATGGTGQQIVHKLLERGRAVLALVRDIQTARVVLGDVVELIAGDVTIPATLPAAFEKVDLCICTIGSRAVEGKQNPEDIDYKGVAAAVDAATEATITHFVLLSSLGVTHDDHPLNKYNNVLKWKLKGENHLRQSGLNYTIIRPGGLRDEAGGNGIQFAQGDTISGVITRDDTAEVCVQALGNGSAFCKTLEIINTDDTAAKDFDAIFAAMEKD